MTSTPHVHFGGPDRPPGALRRLLSEHVQGVPAGGSIHWVTYYLRHRRLAEELVRARRRGVGVRLTLEEHPRTPQANRHVIDLLADRDGLDQGFRAVLHPRFPAPPSVVWRPHLHEKIYCFSHPEPVAFIGSYNPVNDEPEEDPGLVREAGDMDRGHNALVAIRDPGIVCGLIAHTRHMHASAHGVLERLHRAPFRTLRGAGLEVHFWPRTTPHPVLRLLSRCAPGTRVRMAASHIKGRSSTWTLSRLARRGLQIEILADASHRRVPHAAEQRLRAAGIGFRRIALPEGLPMHNKFVLIDAPEAPRVIFGSYNWTERSRWLSHEVAAVSSNRDVYDAFAERWELMAVQAQ